MKRLLILVPLILVGTAGCAKVQHLDEALRLKDFAAEKDAQATLVADRDARFDKMLARVKAGEDLTHLGIGEALRRAFGEPVLVLPSTDHPGYEEWLYRHQIQKEHESKIYVMVAPNDRIILVRLQDAR